MSDVAVEVQGLSKLYKIGAAQRRRQSMRDELGEALAAPAHWLAGLARRRAKGAEGDGNRQGEDTIWALKDVSFKIERGEVFGIIGRNGAGKSTLLKILSRITKPTEGRARIHGSVGSLLEVGTGFHPELTGRENIFLNGSILGVKKGEIERAFDDIVAFSEIEQFIDTPVKFYSTGMYVRLAFSVATQFTPEILIVDEVLAVGDLAFQQKSLERMSQISRGGRTVLLVSHRLDPITGLAARAMWLERGRIAEIGDPETVVANYLELIQGPAKRRETSVTLADLPVGEVAIKPPPVVKGMALTRVYVMDGERHIQLAVPCAEPFYVALEYWVHSWTNGLRAEFELVNQHGHIILHATTADSPASAAAAGTPGGHRAFACIPGAWLAPGRYRLGVSLWSPGEGYCHEVKEAFAFDIVGQGPNHAGDAILCPLLSWSVE